MGARRRPVGPELARRLKAGWAVEGAWTRAHGDALGKHGFLWSGRCWVAPSAELRDWALTLKDLPPPALPWDVTVYADAGWKDYRARLAWRCCLNSRHTFEGVHEEPCVTSHLAEARALLLGVQATLRTWPVPERGGVLYLHSDAQAVLDDFTRTPLLEEVKEILAMVPKRVRIDVKHVSRHGSTHDRDGRSIRRVDKLSNLRGK